MHQYRTIGKRSVLFWRAIAGLTGPAALALVLMGVSGTSASDWTFESVYDGQDGAMWMNVAVDSSGVVHADYHATSVHHYAYRDSGGWTLDRVFSGGDVDLTLDRNDTVYLSRSEYVSSSGTREIRSSYRSPYGQWTDEILAPGGMPGRVTRDFDTWNRPRMAYVEQDSDTLYYLYCDDGYMWYGTPVASGEDFSRGAIAAFALDGGNRPHFVWKDDSNGEMHHYFLENSYWQTQTFEVSDFGTSLSSMVRGVGNELHVCYDEYSNGLCYAKFDGTGWTTEVIDPNCRYADQVAVDSAGRPYISYTDSVDGTTRLKLARYNGADWEIETIANRPEGSVGVDVSSLAIDQNDGVHLLYNTDENEVRYAYREKKPNPTDTWTGEVVRDVHLERTSPFAPGQITPWQVNDGGFTINVNYEGDDGEQRALLEFDTSSVPDGARITSANIILDVMVYNSTSSLDPQIRLYGSRTGYASGAIQEEVGNFLGKSETVTDTGELKIRLDPEYIQSSLAEFDDLGVVVLGSEYGLPVSFAALEYAIYGRSPARLELAYYLEGAIDGDLNGDGVVSSDDLDIVRANWGQQVTAGDWESGDPTGDGFVGSDDLDVIRANWGQGTPPAPSSMPEPVSGGLLITGLLCLAARRRFRADRKNM